MTFDPPFEATELVRLLDLRGAFFVVSGDVHQRFWSVVVKTGDVPDTYNKRIATENPKLGGYALELRALARPEGPLPRIVAGASPAYPLRAGATKVVSLEVRRLPED